MSKFIPLAQIFFRIITIIILIRDVENIIAITQMKKIEVNRVWFSQIYYGGNFVFLNIVFFTLIAITWTVVTFIWSLWKAGKFYKLYTKWIVFEESLLINLKY